MNQLEAKAHNRSLVLRAVKRATRRGRGARAAALPGSTKLSLRTVQTHLRSLRSEGLIYNHRGLWLAIL